MTPETLRDDESRCGGMPWPGFGVEPECLGCARYIAGKRDDPERRFPWAPAPEHKPCERRIPE